MEVLKIENLQKNFIILGAKQRLLGKEENIDIVD